MDLRWTWKGRKMPEAYEKAGVNVEAGYDLVRRIQSHAARTARPGAGGIGGFGGLFDLSLLGCREPVLVSGTDGVGTKLMVAKQMGRHDTIGVDCVAMCVNDILAQGAQPLFFLDYIACGHNDPALLEQVVKGVADGCVQAGAALIGGETAEMPDMYGPDEYDLAGFTVGLVEKEAIVDGSAIRPGDLLLGLPSSGLHSNGFSLVRKAFLGEGGPGLDSRPASLGGHTLGEELLKPTRIYVSALKPLFDRGLLNGAAHITGGGFVEKVPRILPDGVAARFRLGSWRVPPIFDLVEVYGGVDHREMYNIFNMGIGMVLVVGRDRLEAVEETLRGQGEEYSLIGDVVASSDGGVILEDGE